MRTSSKSTWDQTCAAQTSMLPAANCGDFAYCRATAATTQMCMARGGYRSSKMQSPARLLRTQPSLCASGRSIPQQKMSSRLHTRLEALRRLCHNIVATLQLISSFHKPATLQAQPTPAIFYTCCKTGEVGHLLLHFLELPHGLHGHQRGSASWSGVLSKISQMLPALTPQFWHQMRA